MAGLPQLNSFVSKFLNLWQIGCDASLHVETHAGKATIHLQVGLGQAPPLPPSAPPPPPHHHRVPGPSRQRRTQRRALALKEADKAKAKTDAEKAEQEADKANKAAEEAINSEVAEEVTMEVVTAVKAKENEVDDEFYPNDVFFKAEEIEKISFLCYICRMLFLTDSYKDGDEILNYESCRRHIGVAKCAMCAIVLVAQRCHRQVCHNSA